MTVYRSTIGVYRTSQSDDRASKLAFEMEHGYQVAKAIRGFSLHAKVKFNKKLIDKAEVIDTVKNADRWESTVTLVL